MGSEIINDYERKERKLILKGKQKTLTSERLDEKINWDIVDKFEGTIRLSKIIESNDKEFEAVVDGFFINATDFYKIEKVAKEIYGEDCGFHFNSESKWNISFGVMKKEVIDNANKD